MTSKNLAIFNLKYRTNGLNVFCDISKSMILFNMFYIKKLTAKNMKCHKNFKFYWVFSTEKLKYNLVMLAFAQFS